MSQRAVIRMVDPKVRKLLAAGAAAAVVGFVAVGMVAPDPTQRARGAAAGPSIPATPMRSEPAPSSALMAAADDARAAGLRTYALPVSELSGLRPDAQPGTELELWVAWDPPVTKGPRVQLLLRRVLLQGILAPPSRELPAMALIAIRARDTADLIYGDRYGTLSVTGPDL